MDRKRCRFAAVSPSAGDEVTLPPTRGAASGELRADRGDLRDQDFRVAVKIVCLCTSHEDCGWKNLNDDAPQLASRRCYDDLRLLAALEMAL